MAFIQTIITFKTSRFDVTQETPNESNALAGQSVLNWLRDELAKHQYESTVPGEEDWGWYIDVKGPGGSYLVGACAEVEYRDAEDEALSYDVAQNEVHDWTLQIHKHRTVMEKLLGKNKLAADDLLCAQVERFVQSDSSLKEILVVRDAV
jgi:hypothetical protein